MAGFLFMSSFTFDEAKLKALISNLESAPARIPTHTWQFRVTLLKMLEHGIKSAMGSVSGRGGYPIFDFSGSSWGGRFDLKTQGEGLRGGGLRWVRLKPYTIKSKLYEKMDPYTVEQMDTEALYRYAANVQIWKDTGASHDSVHIQDTSVVISTRQAKLMEEGEPGRNIPARPIMKAAKVVFEDYLRLELAKSDSLLADQIRREFKSFLKWE